jgi:LemA protein
VAAALSERGWKELHAMAVGIIVVIIVLVLFFGSMYNKLQRLAHQVRRFNGNIMVSLQKRADLANRLMDIAREYGSHEKLTHITVSNNFRDAMRETNEALSRINVMSQNFPQLQANATYNGLMRSLSEIEAEIQRARETYNFAASEYNSSRSQLPQGLFASALGFVEAPYFDADNLEAIKEFRTDDGAMLKKVLSVAVDKTAATVRKGAEGLSNAISNKMGDIQPPQGGVSQAWSLVCINGPYSGNSFPVDSVGFVIGSDPESAGVILDSPSVSRAHVRVCAAPGGIAIEDLGSSNGTFLLTPSGGRVKVAGRELLADKQRFLIGDDFVFEAECVNSWSQPPYRQNTGGPGHDETTADS